MVRTVSQFIYTASLVRMHRIVVQGSLERPRMDLGNVLTTLINAVI